MNVLLSNDDGITSPGIRALRTALMERGHAVFTVAPMRQQSGVSHSITVFEPLRSQNFNEEGFEGIGIYGTPADCVKLGLAELVPWRPDLVMAGINLGRNVGPDVFYSGTIGAAAEGAHAGVPSMALSHANAQASPDSLARAAGHAVELAGKIEWQRLPGGRVINVNYPSAYPSRGLRICPQAPAVWENAYSRHSDPRGWPYWWMEGEIAKDTVPADSDIDLLAAGYITLTPLQFEHTDKAAAGLLSQMGIES